MKTLHLTALGTFAFLHDGVEIVDPLDGDPQRCGFEVWGTGGGNTAWRQDFLLPDGRKCHMLVTDGDLGHEVPDGQDLEVGVYLDDQDHSEPFAFWMQPRATTT